MKADWEVKKLGEIGNIFSGNSINEKEKKSYMDLSKSGLFYIATKDISSNSIIDYENGILIPNDKLSNFRIAHKNSVLICAEGGSAGRKFAFNSEHDICFVNKLFAFESKSEILSKFVFYYYQSIFFEKDFKNRLTGLIGGVSLQKFREISIPVPPLPEQKRIVEILDQKFAQIDQLKQNAEKNLQNAKELFQTELTKAFSNNTWEKKAIGEVCSKKENIKWKNENVSTEYQYIDLSAVDRESKNISDTQIITKESAPSRAQQIVKTGDILFGTTRPTLKRFCLLADEYDGQICSTGFCVIRPNQNIISSDWMFYQFYNDEFYKYIEPLQKGANYPAVTDKDIMNYNIFVPPLPEQKRIVKELDTLSEKVRQLEEIYTKQIANCDELKQSFLKKAFEGEL